MSCQLKLYQVIIREKYYVYEDQRAFYYAKCITDVILFALKPYFGEDYIIRKDCVADDMYAPHLAEYLEKLADKLDHETYWFLEFDEKSPAIDAYKTLIEVMEITNITNIYE